MAIQQRSAFQQLQKKELSLEQALALLVNAQQELDTSYLDQALLASMKPTWPREKAVPLVFFEGTLFVACPEDYNPDLATSLSSLVNNFKVEIIKVRKTSWDKAFGPKPVFGFPSSPDNPATTKTAFMPNATKTAATKTTTTKASPEKKKNILGADLQKTIDAITVKNIDASDENSIGREVRELMGTAAKMSCSDIHFEPTEKFLIVRFRIDGVLRDIVKYPCNEQADYRKIMIARIKIIADLNIAESRIPQDGRVTEIINNHKLDLRVSTLPTLYGEKCVIRLLPHENSFLELSDLGMGEDMIPEYESWLGMSQGMVLITGPTGSGKTSTLYTSLAKLVDTTRNVVTVEDPVEFQLARVNQVQVNVKAGLTFASGLRSILRQDPDIVMVGEIRDKETAEIAIQAALTGHLVLSTLHTNDAASTVTRLIDMGVQPYLVASALVGVVAQRLLRRVCYQCLEEYSASPEELKVLGLSSNQQLTLVKGRGCQNCNNTGYSGREGVFEIMHLNRDIKRLIQEGADLEKIRNVMKANKVKSLYDVAVQKVLDKKSTVEELLRVVSKEE